jgi:hypothetical protein
VLDAVVFKAPAQISIDNCEKTAHLVYLGQHI